MCERMTKRDSYISDCGMRVPSSGTMKAATRARELEAQGRTIIKLGIGEPNFKTPQPIIDAAYKAMNEGKTGYTSSRGILPLREKIATIYSKETNVEINPHANVIVTPGAKASLFSALFSLINPGDNMILISPYWPSYQGIATFIGAKTKPVPAHFGDFEFPFESIKSAIDEQTKLLLVNSPCNPTGAIFEEDALRFIKDISEDYDIYIISDEIYKKITFESQYVSYLTVTETLDRTLIIDGLSKSHAMTGWRIGYSIGDKELISSMNRLQQNVSSCVNTPTQYAALTALDLTEPTKMMVAEYKKRRDKAFEFIEKSAYLSCRKPEGAFYLFIQYKGDICSDEFVSRVLEEKSVAVTAGTVFGVQENYFRLSLASKLEDILEGLKRIDDLLEKINK